MDGLQLQGGVQSAKVWYCFADGSRTVVDTLTINIGARYADICGGLMDRTPNKTDPANQVTLAADTHERRDNGRRCNV